ncbi:MAG: CRISPR-associated endoribonuclease Cas6 [Thermofilaceae archaeon]
MKRLQIFFNTKQLQIPTPFNGILQATIYNNLSPELFYLFHEIGFRSPFSKKVFKYFNFSPLFAKNVQKQENLLVLEKNVHFYISSFFDRFIDDLKRNLQKNGLKFNGKVFNVKCKEINFTVDKLIFDSVKRKNENEKVLCLLKVYNLFVGRYLPKSKVLELIDFYDEKFENVLTESVYEKIKTLFHYGLISQFEIIFHIQSKKLLSSQVIRLRKNFEPYQTYTAELLIESNLKTLEIVWACGLGNKTTNGLGFVEILKIM